jgi:YidC/Oxa1 family membrane protein insertase
MFATIGYWICIPFSALLRLFYTLTGSYGMSLILFTLVIKLILLPFQMKSKKSMVRMNRMSGRMKDLQKKYANNQAKLGEEMQKLYAEEGVNPMSGCIWGFLPLPVLMALYYIIREPIVFFMNFGGKAAGESVLTAAKGIMTSLGLTWTTTSSGADGAYAQIEIVKQLASNADKSAVKDFFAANPNWINLNYNFLGIDMSTVPSHAFKMIGQGVTWAAVGLILIPILSAVLQLVMMHFSMKGQPQAGATAASNKMMMYSMPLFSLWIGYTLPAALGVYWIAQSAFSAVQEAFLGRFYNNKLETEEDERQRRVEEDRHRRQEEARLRQEEQRRLSAKQQAAAKKKAAKAAQEGTKGKKSSTNENGRVGERPYARGRAYSEEHYQNPQNPGKK